ncbi:hypothetical protein GGS23DRAFT_599918 [Durotheca rogersii]|uniref:uncharacterized protein n=1 Tax=Durotheca rogersii TaxID=419775 RepID=UPI00221E4288|nr:uncharacterized protein GGS23DRAFT_599918 [Durotheca rogersii]KAI5859989.1 hypothetical protein GGS23DRAFT_599918 [Durotheca rogersii]
MFADAGCADPVYVNSFILGPDVCGDDNASPPYLDAFGSLRLAAAQRPVFNVYADGACKNLMRSYDVKEWASEWGTSADRCVALGDFKAVAFLCWGFEGRKGGKDRLDRPTATTSSSSSSTPSAPTTSTSDASSNATAEAAAIPPAASVVSSSTAPPSATDSPSPNSDATAAGSSNGASDSSPTPPVQTSMAATGYAGLGLIPGLVASLLVLAAVI